MTVKELIIKLKSQKGDLEIFFPSSATLGNIAAVNKVKNPNIRFSAKKYLVSCLTSK
jgi:hypothetical protein